MPYVGNTFIGAKTLLNDSDSDANNIEFVGGGDLGNIGLVSGTQNVFSMRAYVRAPNGGRKMKGVLYEPGPSTGYLSRVAVTEEVDVPTDWAWTTLEFSSPYPTISGGSGPYFGVCFDGGDATYYTQEKYNDDDPADTWIFFSLDYDNPQTLIYVSPSNRSRDQEHSCYLVVGDQYDETLTDGMDFGDSTIDVEPLSDGLTFGETVVASGTQTWSETLTDGIEIGDSVAGIGGTMSVTDSDGIRFGDSTYYNYTSPSSEETIGNCSPGASWDVGASPSNTVWATKIINNTGKDLRVTSLKAYMKSDLGPPGVNYVKAIIYDNSGNLVAVTNGVTGQGTHRIAGVGWVTWDGQYFNVTPILTAGATYYCGVLCKDSGKLYIKYDTGSFGDGKEDTSNNWGSPHDPVTWTSTNNAQYSVCIEGDTVSIFADVVTDGLSFGDSTSATISGSESITDGLTLGDSFTDSTFECPDVLWTDETDDESVQFTDDSANEDIDILWTDCLTPFVKFDTDATDGITFGDSTVEGFFGDDGMVFLDVPEAETTFVDSLTDGVDFGDTLTPELTVAGTLSDGMTFGDSVSVELIVSGTLTDGIVFGEPIVSTGDSAEDGLVFGDTTSATLTIPKSTSDGVVFGDTTSRDYIAGVIATDGVVFGDTPTTSGNTYAATATDGVVFGEVLDTECVFVVTLSDGTVIGDTATPNNVIDLAASDGLVFGDSVAVDVTFYIELDDGVEFGESLVAELYTAVVSVTDGIVFSDVSVGEKHTISATFVTKDRTYQFIIKSRAYQFVTKDRVIESIALTKPATFVTKDRTYTFVARTRPDRRQ